MLSYSVVLMLYTGGWANKFSSSGGAETPKERALTEMVSKLTMQLEKAQKDHAEQLKVCRAHACFIHVLIATEKR